MRTVSLASITPPTMRYQVRRLQPAHCLCRAPSLLYRLPPRAPARPTVAYLRRVRFARLHQIGRSETAGHSTQAQERIMLNSPRFDCSHMVGLPAVRRLFCFLLCHKNLFVYMKSGHRPEYPTSRRFFSSPPSPPAAFFSAHWSPAPSLPEKWPHRAIPTAHPICAVIAFSFCRYRRCRISSPSLRYN